MIGIVFLLIAIGILMKIWLNRKKNKSIDRENELRKKLIHISDDFKGGEPITIKENGHIVTTIFMNKEDLSLRVCPNCETENPPSSQKCFVCHFVMKGEAEDVL